MRRAPKLLLGALVALSVAFGVAPATALATEVNSAEGLSTALESGGEITLSNDIEVNTKQNWTITNEVVLNLNGHSITSTYAEMNNYIMTVNGGSLTVTDNFTEGTGKIEATDPSYGYGIQLKGAGSSFTLLAGTIKTTQETVDIYTSAQSCSIAISGGKLISTDDSVLNIRGSSTTVNITAGDMESDARTGVYISCDGEPDSNLFNMTGGTLTHTGGMSGAIQLYEGATLTIGGTAEVTSSSYAVQVQENTILNVEGGKLTSTGSCVVSSGETSTVNITGGEISGSKTVIRSEETSTVNISGGKIETTSTSANNPIIKPEGDSEIAISGGQLVSGTDISNIPGNNPNITVTGGIFKTSSGGKVDVSDNLPSGMGQDDEGNVVIKGDAVAKIGDAYYATLSDVLIAAKDGDTITVLTNITLSSPVTISGTDVTLDLGRNTVRNTNGAVLVVAKNSDVKIKNGTLFSSNRNWAATLLVNTGATLTISDDAVVVGPYGLGLADTTSETAGSDVKIDIYGTVRGVNESDGTDLLSSGGTAGIGVNGNTKSTADYATIHIHGGAVVSGSQGSSGNTNYDDGPAIYAAGYAKWIIDEGATLSGSEALSIKSGNFTINGGTFIATGTYADPATSWGNGTEATGAAISITNNNGYAKNVEMVISGGTFTSENGYAIYENDTEAQNGSALGANGLSITNGTFTGAEGVGAVSSTHAEKFISGGTFSANLTEKNYLADEVKYEVAHAAGGFSYAEDIEAAQELAQPGDNITDLTNESGQTLTLTLNYNDNATENSEYTVASGTEVTLPKPTRSGYSFLGWFDSQGTKQESPYTVNGDATLTAHWSLIPAPSPAPTTHDVTVAAAENGKVSVDPASAAEGEEVTVTVTPDEGYELASVSVKDSEGNEVEVTANEDGTYSFEMPAGGATVAASFRASLPFSDADGWYRGAVAYVYSRGLMTGYEGTALFGPDDPLGREQAAMVLYRALGAGAEAPACGLADVEPGAWYAGAVDWAAGSGLIAGYGDGSGLFGVGDALTRDQFAQIIARVAGADLSKADPSALEGFSDGGEVAGWAVPAVSWAVRAGVLEGSDDGSGGTELRSGAEISRGEMATMIMRAAEAGLLPAA